MEQYLNRWMKKTRVENVKVNSKRITALFNLLDGTSNRTLANYLVLHAVHESALYLNADMRNTYRSAMEILDPPGNFFTNNRRWSWCVKEVFKYFPTQANAIYARKYFPRDLKLKLLTITDRMFDEVAEKFKEKDFLDEYTRINALKKLNATERSMGIDERWFDEEKTDQMSKKYNFNYKNFLYNKLQAQRNLDQLEKNSDAYTFIEANSNNLLDRNKIGLTNTD